LRGGRVGNDPAVFIYDLNWPDIANSKSEVDYDYELFLPDQAP